jgi:hypothetical protein
VNDTVKAILVPALHTFWQAFVALLGIWWVASGLALFSSVSDVASARRVAVAVGTAVLAAALSALKSTIKTVLAERKVDLAHLLDVPDGPEPDDMEGIAGPITTAHIANDAIAQHAAPLVTGTAAPAQTPVTRTAATQGDFVPPAAG